MIGRKIIGCIAVLPAMALLAGCMDGSDGVKSAAAPPPIPHAIQLVRWTSYYVSGVDDQARTVRQKYDRGVIAGGLANFTVASLDRVRSALPSDEAVATANLKLAVRNCSTGGPALLVSTSRADNSICIAPLLMTSVFFEASGTSVYSLRQHIIDWGLDPSTYDGTYNDRLNRAGLTQADWLAVSSAHEGEWNKLQRSTDFLVAYLAYCDVLEHPADRCVQDAAALVVRLDGVLDISAVRSALNHAQGDDTADLGFRSAGDLPAVRQAISVVGGA